MSLWLRNTDLPLRPDSYETVAKTGAALTSAFDLASIPEDDDERDTSVVQRLAIAESSGAVTYVGAPTRLLKVKEGHAPISPDGGELLISRFVFRGKPSIG